MRRWPAPTGFSYPASNPPPLRLVLCPVWTQRPATISQRPTHTRTHSHSRTHTHTHAHTHSQSSTQSKPNNNNLIQKYRSPHRKEKNRTCWHPVSSYSFVLALRAINFSELHQHWRSNRTGYISFGWSHHICGYEHCVSQRLRSLSPSLSHTETNPRLPSHHQQHNTFSAVSSCAGKHINSQSKSKGVWARRVTPIHTPTAGHISLQSPPRLPWGLEAAAECSVMSAIIPCLDNV